MLNENNNVGTIPFFSGSELTAESFKVAQYDNTYLLAAPRYYQFYSSYIKPRIGMYSGWIEGFHNTEYGVLPSLFLQKIGAGIVGLLFGRPAILNSQNADTNTVIENKFKRTHFTAVAKEAYGFCLAGGTGLIKLNKDGRGDLRLEAIPMDKFFVETDAYGDIEKVKCFIACYHDTISASQEYYLCEERFFKYTTVASEKKRFPFVHYTVYKTSSNVVNETTPAPSDSIMWRDIPPDIRSLLNRDYGEIYLDDYCCEKLRERSGNVGDKVYERCKLLPFNDDLGVRLIKFTNSIPAFTKLPFGQPIADLLMNENYSYDQLKFFERLEVYIAKGRVMIDEGQVNPNDPHARKSALDPLVYSFYDNAMSEVKDGKPFGIQLDLRADRIRMQKQNILNDVAFSLNLSSSTIAAWLSDGSSQKTATEIEYERTKTESFISEKLEIIREPLQELVDIFFYYYGVSSPQLNIMPELQTSKTESIKLFSELYDKGQVTAKTLAEKILGTCSIKEVNELASFIDMQKQTQNLNQQTLPPMGEVESQSGSIGNE